MQVSAKERIPGSFQPGEGSSVVDLRSDTITKPTQSMWEAMLHASLGDDGLDGDVGVRALEQEVAALLGKEAALFMPSATMANLVAILVQSRRQRQVLMEATAHIYTTERGGSTLAGVSYTPVTGHRGAMDIDLLRQTLNASRASLSTSLVCVETSHNNAGGAVLTLEHLREVHEKSAHHGVPVHLDGARLFNAAIALQRPARDMTVHVDTVTICLSKGLSAPAGAVLAGPHTAIQRGVSVRKMLGGTQRQIGIMAAAGLAGLRTMVPRLAEDHRRAIRLSTSINALDAGLVASLPETNIVMVDLGSTRHSVEVWVARLEGEDVLVRPWGARQIRCVTHRHIDDGALERAIAGFSAIASGD